MTVREMDMSGIRVVSLAAGRTGTGIGIAHARPRISWRIESFGSGVRPSRQEAYELRAQFDDGSSLTTGCVPSQSLVADWPFRELVSRERVQIDVRAWTDGRSVTEWSTPLTVEPALLRTDDWDAKLIGPSREIETGRESAVFRVRRSFESAAGILRARVYATAHGVIVPYVNGLRASENILDPGWTSYDHRLRFRTYDVTDLVREGANVIGFELAEGWYRGRFGFDHGARGIYGIRIGVLAQLEIEYDDGHRDIIATDEGWHASVGPTTFTNLYDGEETDLRLADLLWSSPQRGRDAPQAVSVERLDMSTLEPADSPPVRRTQEVAPVSTTPLRESVVRYDFGQNLVGRLRITATGPAGATITIRHAEVLEGEELGVRPLRLARATDRLTLAGDPAEWEPEFTTHGFRYAEIAVSDARVRVESISAVVVHSDMERVGWLETSNPLLNRLFENSVWGLRGNFVDLPTDCPQRDERLGWTGDINVFASTATMLYDVSGVLGSWLKDLKAEQLSHSERIPPMFVPSIIREPHLAGVWGDATVGVPWALYARNADIEQLRDSYPSAKAWINLVESRLGPTGVWDTDVQLGDWLDPTAPADRPHAGRTDANLVATAYFIRSARITSQMAERLDEPEDARRYADTAARALESFRREYMTPTGRLSSDSQTAYAIAICFDLYQSGAERRTAGDRLRALVRAAGHCVGTGFVGTALILDALTLTGSAEDAWNMLLQTAPPSFLYPVTMGATTAWERWDSMLPDGSINPGEMTSFNHYALGAVAGWMLRAIGGITSTVPGGGHVRIEPLPGGEVTWAESRQILARGEVRASWRLEDGRFQMETELPIGIEGTVALPDGSVHEITAGVHTWECAMPHSEPASSAPSRGRMVIRTRYP